MSEETNGRGTSIPRGYQQEDTEARKSWVKEYAGIDIDDTLEDKAEDLQGIIENHIGFMKVPMAVVGPMTIDGKYAKGEFCVPVCTLEGTLAMSMNRGIYASVHGHCKRTFKGTNRNTKLSLCVFSINSHWANYGHRDFHKTNVVFNNSLKVFRFIF